MSSRVSEGQPVQPSPAPTCPHCEGFNIHTDPYECIKAQAEQIQELQTLFTTVWIRLNMLTHPIAARERAQ
jgi:hypothetical protein